MPYTRPKSSRSLVFAFLLTKSCLAQITPVKLGGLSGVCPVSTETIRVLPGNFTRAIDSSFTTTSDPEDDQLSQLAGCQFLSFDPSFDVLLGSNRTIYQLGGNVTSYNYAFEGPVYLPETDEVFFTSEYTSGRLSRVSLQTGQVVPVDPETSVGAANGATNYRGQVALTTFGAVLDEGLPAGVLLLDPYNGTWSWLVDNFFGLRFGGPDDVVALNDGSLIFTDTGYAEVAGLSPEPDQVDLALYILPPTGPPRVLINGLPGTGTPNGVALSPDQSTLYTSTTPLTLMNPPLDQNVTAHSIYAFDLVRRNGGIFAQNMRLFCTIDVGFADGFKVDSAGNIFTTSGDGVQVFNPAGSLIGKIIIPDATVGPALQPVNNLVFAGNRLVIMHHTNILMLPLKTTGPVLT